MSVALASQTAEYVPAPIAGEVYRDNLAATSSRYEIPTSWKGRWVTFYHEGTDYQVVFGDSTVSVTLNQTSGVASEVLTANDASGVEISSLPSASWFVKKDPTVTHFAVVGAAASDTWAARATG